MSRLPSSPEDEVVDELQDFSGEVVGGVVGETAPGLFEEDILSPEQLQEPLTTEAEENEQTLPDGWEAIVDPGSGETYYYNSNIDETSWERPVSSTLSVDAPAPEEVHGVAPQIYELSPEVTNAEHDDAMTNRVGYVSEEDAVYDTREQYGGNPEDEIAGSDDITEGLSSGWTELSICWHAVLLARSNETSWGVQLPRTGRTPRQK
jgi:hypothetical protein